MLFLAVGLIRNQPVAAEEPPVLAPPPSPSLVSIFNGKDLSGWSGDPRLWSVSGGVIRGETTPENAAKRNTFLIWQEGQTKDFELRCSFRCNAINNSGIQYRSKHFTDASAPNPWVLKGYQYEIRNENVFPNVSGFIYDEGGSRKRICLTGQRAQWNQDGKQVLADNLVTQQEFKTLFRLDDWNDVVIIARGNHILHYLNGRLILDFTDNHPELTLLDGQLGFQLHAGKPMWAEFKDVRFAEL